VSFQEIQTDSTRETVPLNPILFDTPVVQGTLNKNVGIAGLASASTNRVCAQLDEPDGNGDYASFTRTETQIDFVNLETPADDPNGIDIRALDTFVQDNCPKLSLLRCVQCPKKKKK